jgi:hypothetical protein
MKWIWLFPLTYLVHLSEEYWGGEGFPAWFSRLTGADFAVDDFLILNAIALCLVVTAMGLVSVFPSCRFLLVALGGVILLNAFLHVGLSIVTRSYSPGAVSGLLCWAPLGIYALRREWRELSHSTFGAGIAVALGLHAVVSLSALYG